MYRKYKWKEFTINKNAFDSVKKNYFNRLKIKINIRVLKNFLIKIL